MRRFSRVTLCALFVTSATGCMGLTAKAVPSKTVTPSATAGAPTRAPAARSVIRTPAPVAKLSAACPLLSAPELKTLLGGASSRTRLTAAEEKTSTSGTYLCRYGSRGRTPFELVVTAFSATAFSPTMAVSAVVKRHRQDNTRIRKVTGVGQAAVFFAFTDGTSELVAGKRSHGQVRMAIFGAPALVPERKFADVVRLVISRV